MIRFLLLKLIRLYQLTLSPFIGHVCRFYPTCSSYTHEAIEKKDLLKAPGWVSSASAAAIPGTPAAMIRLNNTIAKKIARIRSQRVSYLHTEGDDGRSPPLKHVPSYDIDTS